MLSLNQRSLSLLLLVHRCNLARGATGLSENPQTTAKRKYRGALEPVLLLKRLPLKLYLKQITTRYRKTELSQHLNQQLGFYYSYNCAKSKYCNENYEGGDRITLQVREKYNNRH